jgi:uncharacterized protein YgiM (DUF1202 family)
MSANADLAAFMDELGTQMKVEVGEELAKAEMPEEEVTPEVTPTPEVASTTEFEEVKTVRATTVVNVRASDSEQADKVGKAQEGQEFKLLEERANGWSKIEFEGAEDAFIKTQYLETVKVEKVATSVGAGAEAESEDKESEEKSEEKPEEKKEETKKEDASNIKTSGTVTVQNTLRVRSKASTDSEKLGTVYGGEKLEVIEKQSDGWTKVKYKDTVGYVKSEFVE